MAIITTSAQTNHAIYMSDTSQFQFKSGAAASANEFSWLAGPFSTNAVFIHGSNFTYSGSGDSTEFASGTISRIAIDVGNDNGSDTEGDLVITGTEGLIAANILKSSPQAFWNEILKGADTFQLDGLNEDAVGLVPNLIFGDDFSCLNSSSNHADTGAADVILGGDNIFDLIGDVNEVKGGRTDRNGPINIAAQYTGGNDQITSAFTDRNVMLIGDANSVFEKGILIGGNDTLDNSRSDGSGSHAAGDVSHLFSLGSVTGGDDHITVGSNGAGSGDVFVMGGSNAFLQGGDDLISGIVLACAGDVQAISSGTSGNTINGGNDTINGSNSADTVAGEVFVRGSQGNTITGGDDIINGRGGDDELYGEVAVGNAAGVTGGNDRLNGGGGDDQLFGQTGDDVLDGGGGNDTVNGGSGSDILRGGGGKDVLTGVTGNDRLIGEAGADRFDFNPGSDADRILDFTDDGGAEDDVIDVRGYNFASLGAIGKSAAGDNLVLDLGGGNTITVVGYLTGHASAEINDDILI